MGLPPPARTRVVHLVATLREGGAETLVRSLVPRLAADPSLDVRIVSVYDPNIPEAERAALAAPIVEMGRRSRADVSFFPRLVHTLRALRPHVVHAHLHTGKYVGRAAAIAAGVPSIVFTEHGDEAGGALRDAINRVLHGRTNRFIVFTEAQRLAFARDERVPLERIVVIPNGILALDAVAEPAAVRAELDIPADAPLVAIPARLAAQKNQAHALRALHVLRERGDRRTIFAVIGEGPDAAMLRCLARELRLDEAVRFLGFRNDARRIVCAADLYAMASTWERMPLALGEAMADGVPVVTTPWEGVQAFVRDRETGFVARDFSVEAFADALDAALADPVMRGFVASRARRIARERFDLDRTARAHADLYRLLRAGAAS